MTNPIIPVPVLSSAGWVSDPSGKADALLAHFFESMKSQTAIYGKNVASLQYVLQQYSGDANRFTSELQVVLETYLSRYYDLAIVTIASSANDLTNVRGSVEVTIHSDLTENGITYSMGNLLKITNSKITAVTRINNG